MRTHGRRPAPAAPSTDPSTSRRPRISPAALVSLAVVMVMAAPACSSGGGPGAASGGPVDATVRVVSQNILHGVACPADSQRCHLTERLELFTRQLSRAGCPELVTLQEADATVVAGWRPLLARVCRGRYRIVWDGEAGLDREVIATTLRVLAHERHRLAGPLRTATWVRVAGPVGVVDLVSTHLASSSDDGPCGPDTCPPPCRPADTLNTCQGRQAAALLRERTGPRSVGILAGDLNARPGSPTIAALRAAGLRDTSRLAGRPECKPSTGAGCTSGRADTDESDLRDPSSRQRERIDYVFVTTARSCRAVAPTGLFNPAPETPTAPDALVFPSDHTAVEATLRCRTTAADRAAARTAARSTPPRSGPSSTGGSSPSATVPAAADAAIRRAFSAVFDGDAGPPEVRLASLEDSDELRDLFVERLTEQAAIAPRIRVRVDEIRARGPGRAAVTFSLLLDGTPVIDHVAGGAVRSGERWLVSRPAFCAVANVGRETPAPACSGAP